MTVKVRPYRGTKDKYEVDIRFEWPDGDEYRERVKAPVSSKSGAQRWGEQREREYLTRGKPQQKKEEKVVPTVEDFEETFISDYAVANRQKESTICSKRQILKTHLVPMLGKKKLDAIELHDVQRIKAALSEREPKTVNNVLSTLSVMLKVAHEWGLIPLTPFRIKLLKVDNHQPFYFYDFDEYERLVEGAKKSGPENHLVVLLGGDAGLRLGEIAGLEWPCVEFKRNVLVIDKKDWHGHVELPKSGRTREVPMTTRLAAALKAYKHMRGLRVLYGDSDDGLKTLTERIIRNWMMSSEKRAGMYETGRIHILRHSFCSHLAMRGATAKAIQELAGHADLQTTMRYMHLTPAHREGAIRLLDEGRASDARGEMMEKRG
jgi:integrase